MLTEWFQSQDRYVEISHYELKDSYICAYIFKAFALLSGALFGI